ncbi:GntR family transcriptional regulator [Escherichia coli]|nr:GntR family transcriptional regulator [Escherichia coli]
MFVCSVILVNHPFETDFAGKRFFFQKNDVLLTDDVSKSLFLHHPGNVTELRIDECGNDSNLLIVFYVQIMPDDFVMQLHRF